MNETQHLETVSRNCVARICIGVSILELVMCLLALMLRRLTDSGEYSGNVFYYLIARNEPSMTAFLIVLAMLTLVYFLRLDFRIPISRQGIHRMLRRSSILAIALVIFLLTLTGTFVVFHNFALCMDEYLANFQAEIFVSGRIMASVKDVWLPFEEALKPVFVTYDSQKQSWIGIYLPVYAAIRALFMFAGLPSIANPVLAAASIIALFGVARNVWPHRKSYAFVAVLLLAASSQFLVTSMTVYALPAHLCLNLFWLWLYSREDAVRWTVVPWVGVLAVGLHEPHYHALFVLPFLVRLVLTKRWKWSCYFASVYAFGCVVWLMWMNVARPGVTTGGGGIHSLDSTFGFSAVRTPLVQIMSLSLLFSWQSFAMICLALLSLRNWKRFTPFLKDLAWGSLLTFSFYALLKGTQAHGWGYRFCHTILGNLALLGVIGWNDLRGIFGPRKATGFLLASTLVALCIQFPIRCVQVEGFVRPFAQAMGYLNAINKPFVVIDADAVWYSGDLVRNDPFLRNSPKILFAHVLGPELLERLRSLGPVHMVERSELTRFGMRAINVQQE